MPLVTFVLATVGGTLLGHKPPLAYYQTVAFLIPSLLVTLAVQGRFFQVHQVVPPPPRLADRPGMAALWKLGQQAATVALLVYLAAGEFASLYVLAAQHSTALLFGITAGSVVTAFIAVAIVALAGAPSRD